MSNRRGRTAARRKRLNSVILFFFSFVSFSLVVRAICTDGLYLLFFWHTARALLIYNSLHIVPGDNPSRAHRLAEDLSKPLPGQPVIPCSSISSRRRHRRGGEGRPGGVAARPVSGVDKRREEKKTNSQDSEQEEKNKNQIGKEQQLQFLPMNIQIHNNCQGDDDKLATTTLPSTRVLIMFLDTYYSRGPSPKQHAWTSQLSKHNV